MILIVCGTILIIIGNFCAWWSVLRPLLITIGLALIIANIFKCY